VSARPRRRCGWCAVGESVATTPLVMWLLLKQDVNDKGACVLVRRGGGSLDLNCYCLIATDEGLRAAASLGSPPSISGALQGDGGGAHSAQRRWANVQEVRLAEAGLNREACCVISKYVPRLL
jgi:hypothetical protein